MKTRLTIMLSACLFLLSVSLEAQMMTPPGPPPGGAPNPGTPGQAAQKILNLTDAQVTQLKDLRTSFMTNVQTLRTNLQTVQQQIADLLKSTSPDPAQLGKLVLQRQTLQQPLTAALTAYHTSALAVLTQAQKDQVAQIEAALKLAPQAGPLAALGLIEGPGQGGVGPLSGGPGFGPLGRSGPRRGQGMQPSAPQQTL